MIESLLFGLSPQEIQALVNAVSVVIMTLIAVDTWYQGRFKKKPTP